MPRLGALRAFGWPDCDAKKSLTARFRQARRGTRTAPASTLARTFRLGRHVSVPATFRTSGRPERARRSTGLERHLVEKKQKQSILAKVKLAATEVSESASNLDKLLSDLAAAPRAEKTTISQVVQDAFARLKHARAALLDVEKLVAMEAEDD